LSAAVPFLSAVEDVTAGAIPIRVPVACARVATATIAVAAAAAVMAATMALIGISPLLQRTPGIVWCMHYIPANPTNKPKWPDAQLSAPGAVGASGSLDFHRSIEHDHPTERHPEELRSLGAVLLQAGKEPALESLQAR